MLNNVYLHLNQFPVLKQKLEQNRGLFLIIHLCNNVSKTEIVLFHFVLKIEFVLFPHYFK